jgi:predicted RNA-binding Zn-ribbon protein involved in translation (DUF1610 family)
MNVIRAMHQVLYDSRVTMYECRNCGQNLSEGVTECLNCGSEEIADYDLRR